MVDDLYAAIFVDLSHTGKYAFVCFNFKLHAKLTLLLTLLDKVLYEATRPLKPTDKVRYLHVSLSSIMYVDATSYVTYRLCSDERTTLIREAIEQ